MSAPQDQPTGSPESGPAPRPRPGAASPRSRRAVRALILPDDLAPPRGEEEAKDSPHSTRRNGRSPEGRSEILVQGKAPVVRPRLDEETAASTRRLLTGEEAVPGAGAVGGEGSPAGQRPLRSVLHGVDEIVVFSHMNPDPDTIGAGLGLKHLLEARFGKRVDLCYRGIIGRAENRVMMELLAPEMRHARELEIPPGAPAILVDAQPDFGFDRQREDVVLLAVVDHHPIAAQHPEIPFFDVRPDYGSTSTIVTEYLRAERCEPPSHVATALFYGLKTDTCDLSRRTTPADVKAYRWLFSRVDRDLLARIENPPLTPEFFEAFAAAIHHAIRYPLTVITEVGRMPYPDMVAQIADNLIRLQGVEWSICFGLHEQRIYLSVRTTDLHRDAGRVVKRSLQGAGVGGGHDTMAAGRVQLLEESSETYARVVKQLWERFLEVLGEDPEQGRPMLRHEIPPSPVRPGR